MRKNILWTATVLLAAASCSKAPAALDAVTTTVAQSKVKQAAIGDWTCTGIRQRAVDDPSQARTTDGLVFKVHVSDGRFTIRFAPPVEQPPRLREADVEPADKPVYEGAVSYMEGTWTLAGKSLKIAGDTKESKPSHQEVALQLAQEDSVSQNVAIESYTANNPSTYERSGDVVVATKAGDSRWTLVNAKPGKEPGLDMTKQTCTKD